RITADVVLAKRGQLLAVLGKLGLWIANQWAVRGERQIELLCDEPFNGAKQRIDPLGEPVIPFRVEPGGQPRAVVHHVAGEGDRPAILLDDERHAPRRMARRIKKKNLAAAPRERLARFERSVELDRLARRADVARAVHRVLVPERRAPLAKFGGPLE